LSTKAVAVVRTAVECTEPSAVAPGQPFLSGMFVEVDPALPRSVLWSTAFCPVWYSIRPPLKTKCLNLLRSRGTMSAL